MRPVARWLLFVAMLGATVGLVAQRDTVAHLSLAVLAWIGGEWLVLRLRSELAARHLVASRALRDGASAIRTAWVDHTFNVRTRLYWTGPGTLSFLDVRERVPEAVDLVAGTSAARGSLRRGQCLELNYSVRPPSIGKVRFDGVTWRLADLQGFFVHQSFARLVDEYRVLPMLSRVAADPPRVKRHNLLPSAGRHRHRRAGVGSELLQLREYVPGDPLKSIAWRISAKQDRLMCKEFESEVPVRCNILLDTSSETRRGYPRPTALSQLGAAAAAVAAVAFEGRDPVSLCTFDETESRAMRSGSGRSNFLRLVRRLCDVVGQAPAFTDRTTQELWPHAEALCDKVYPDLLDRRVNGDGLRMTLRRRRLRRERFAVVLSETFGLGAGAPARMMCDARYFAQLMQRFLGEHQVPLDRPPAKARSDEQQAKGKIDAAARALTRSLAEAPDNELFVVVADLVRFEHRTEPLLTAIKVARARHHHVMVVCSWPDDLRRPEVKRPVKERGLDAAAAQVPTLLREARQSLFETAYRCLRRRLARLHVPCVVATDTQLGRRVAVELEGLRQGAILP